MTSRRRGRRLTRRAFVQTTVGLSALPLFPVSVIQAQPVADTPSAEAFRVGPAPVEGGRITPYLRAQVERAWRQDARRQARFDAVKTPAELEALQQDLRRSILDAIGGLPDIRTPLNARVVGEERMDVYRIERLVFESVPGVHVTALVYAPETVPNASPTRRPAVLLACGHSPLGKSFANYQQMAARLARLGFVVICWDPVGQGERSQFWDVERRATRYDLVCGEHAVLGNLATIAGAGLGRWMIWDGIRALDYLLTRADVDPARVAITGTSGGGFQSLWIGALDPRIGVVAPSAFVTSLPMRMANRIFEDPVSDPEQDPHGLVAEGVDHAGLLVAAYPRHIHLSAVARDFFPIEGTRLTYRRVRDLFARFGHADRVALSEDYSRHAYTDANQLSAFRFMTRTFGMAVPDALPAVTLLPPERLQVTPTGQVRVDLPGRGLLEVIREYHAERRGTRTLDLADMYRTARASTSETDVVAPWAVAADRGQTGPGDVAWTKTGSSSWNGVTIDRYRLRYDGLQEVPLVHVHRDGATPRPVVLHVDLRGKASAETWSRLVPLLDEGAGVVSLDLPGVGEGRMHFRIAVEPNMESLSDLELSDHPVASVLANHAYNGLLTGRPYLVDALEAIDIAREFSRTQLRAASLAITGVTQAATLAVVATQVLPGLTLRPSTDAEAFSWAAVVERGQEIWPIHYLVSGGGYVPTDDRP